MRSDLRTRLFSRLIIQADGCVRWAGSHNNQGYGTIRVGRTMKYVHRLMWEMLDGPIPEGMHLDHLCGTRDCASLDHMEIVTPDENQRRAHLGGMRDRHKTECLNGHPRNEVNSYRTKPGQLACRVCHREQERRRNHGRA